MNEIPPRSDVVDAIVAWFQSEPPCSMDQEDFWNRVSGKVDELYYEIQDELDELKADEEEELCSTCGSEMNGEWCDNSECENSWDAQCEADEEEEQEWEADSKPRLKIAKFDE